MTAASHRVVVALLALWLAGAGALTVWRAGAADAFDYRHAWVSAHFATIARSYVLTPQAVQVQNNPPLTREVDTYYGMPPLYGALLGLGMRLIGDTPGRLHALALGLTLATAAAIGALARRWFGSAGGLAAAAAFLLLPVTLRYGILLVNISLAILFSVLAVAAWAHLQARARHGAPHTGTIVGGALAFYLAVLSSWEPLLLLGVLAPLALADRARRPLLGALVWYGVAAGAALVTVALAFGITDPAVADQMWERFRLRAGLAEFQPEHFRVHALAEYLPVTAGVPWRAWLRAWLTDLAGIGPVALAALAAALLTALGRRRTADHEDAALGLRAVVLPLAVLLPLYSIAMKHHFLFHDFLGAWLAPAAAFAAGFLVWVARRVQRPVLAFGLVAALTLGLTVQAAAVLPSALRALPEETAAIDFGRTIGDSVPPDGIVLTPALSMIPVYYSRRHVVRGVSDEAIIARNWEQIRTLCPDCRVYLAGTAHERPRFGAFASGPDLSSNPRFFVIDVTDATPEA